MSRLPELGYINKYLFKMWNGIPLIRYLFLSHCSTKSIWNVFFVRKMSWEFAPKQVCAFVPRIFLYYSFVVSNLHIAFCMKKVNLLSLFCQKKRSTITLRFTNLLASSPVTRIYYFPITISQFELCQCGLTTLKDHVHLG